MILFDLNYIAILVSAIIYMGVAALWYSPLMFGRTWMEENRILGDGLENRAMFPNLLYAFGAAIVLSLGLSVLIHIAGMTNWFTGALMGAFAGLLISGPSALPVYVFENRSMRLFMVNEGMPVAALIIMGAVIGGWR